jgi:phosphate transport system protein
MQETRRRFHDELADLETDLHHMGELAADAVRDAVDALVRRDVDLARVTIDRDDPIDELYLRIDQGVLQLLALQSPVASDLRLVSTLMHSCLHLERIGDQAVNVAKLCLITSDLPGNDTLSSQIAEMGTIVVRMVRTAMQALARRDLELCRTLPALDDPVDRLNRQSHLEALKLAEDPRALDWGLHMNLAARALERVGDNAVDIAEQVAYLITGEFIEFTDASHPEGTPPEGD